MSLYDFFIGSTEWYDAHSSTQHADAFPSLEWWRNNARCQNVFGVWNGDTENVLQVTVELSDDAAAQRIAYAIARRTDNDAVLVSRLTVAADEERSMGSTRAYRVKSETRSEGDRTLLSDPGNKLRIGDEISTYAGKGIITNLGTIAGFADVNGKSVRFSKDAVRDAGRDSGYAFVPDVKGDYVAYLVWSDASVTAVN